MRKFPLFLCLLVAAGRSALADTATTNWLNLLFADTLHRTPTLQETNTFQNQLNMGTTPVMIALEVTQSAEFDGLLVREAYKKFLHRTADSAGLNTFTAQLQQGAKDVDVYAQLLGSNEYFQTRATSDNSKFIDALYGDILNRPPSDSERAMAVSLLTSGTSRSAYASTVLNSTEARSVFVMGLYQTYLRRSATTGEINAQVTAIGRGATYDQIRSQILGSQEYMSLAQTLPHSQNLNISTRVRVGTGGDVAIAGFIITGTDMKQVLLRGMGPSVPVPGALADPTLELHDATHTIAANDNWKDTQQPAIQNTGIAPGNDLEAAILSTLPGNNSAFSVILAGRNNGTGIGLIEVYDLAQAANSKLANISTRGFVDVGDNVMIGGLILGPGSNAPAKVVIRAIGPSLSAAGVTGVLADPILELHDANGATLASNDNWKDTQQSEIAATGIPPSNDAESAILQMLVPANYTAIVRGKNDTTGVALAEIYNLP